MKSSGDCEIDGAKSQSSQQCPSIAQCCHILRPNRQDWRLRWRKNREAQLTSQRTVFAEGKKNLCNKKIKNNVTATVLRGLD